MRRLSTPITLAAAAFVAAGGAIHLREWLKTYRHVPGSVPGAFVVKVGFPINAVVSFVLAALLVVLAVLAVRAVHLAPFVVLGAALFEAASLGSLIMSRVGNVLGWKETAWTRGAEQTRAVEIGALLALAVAGALYEGARRQRWTAA